MSKVIKSKEHEYYILLLSLRFDMQNLPVCHVGTILGVHNMELSLSKTTSDGHIPWYYDILPMCNRYLGSYLRRQSQSQDYFCL